MTFARSIGRPNALPTVMQSQQGGALQGYGTSEGVEKAWLKRQRAHQRDVMWRRKEFGYKAPSKREVHMQGRTKLGTSMSSMTRGGSQGLTEIFYSYDTPVAIRTPKGTHVTTQKFSNTTTRHISKWLKMKGYPNTKPARQAAIAKLANYYQNRYKG